MIYIATAQAWDQEMQVRIAHHQSQRPSEWELIEETYYLADILEKMIKRAFDSSRLFNFVDE